MLEIQVKSAFGVSKNFLVCNYLKEVETQSSVPNFDVR